MSEVGWGRPHTSSDSDCNPSRNPSSDSNGMRGIWTPGQPFPIVSEGEFRLGLQSESELGWGRPHPSSDMETPPPVEVAYSKSPGQPKSHCGISEFRLGLQSESGTFFWDFSIWKTRSCC